MEMLIAGKLHSFQPNPFHLPSDSSVIKGNFLNSIQSLFLAMANMGEIVQEGVEEQVANSSDAAAKVRSL